MLTVTPGWGTAIEPLLWREPAVRRSRFEVQETLCRLAQHHGGALYALVDAARDDAVLQLLASGDVDARSLFRGTRQEEFFAGAPILVPCDGRARVLDWLTDEGWGRRAGVFLASRAGFDALEEHLKGLAIVEDAQGVKLFLRLADPLVLHAFLDACTLEERLRVLGPIDVVMMEAGPDELRYFARYDLLQGEPAAPPAALGARFVLAERHERVFEALVLDCFMRRACRELRQRCEPELAGMCDDDLVELVSIGIKRAARRELHLERVILSYLELAVRYGLDFDSAQANPAVAAILDDRSIPAAVRLERAGRMLEGTPAPLEVVDP
jgi:hypothetical protein